jgi:hypothetical protein
MGVVFEGNGQDLAMGEALAVVSSYWAALRSPPRILSTAAIFA